MTNCMPLCPHRGAELCTRCDPVARGFDEELYVRRFGRKIKDYGSYALYEVAAGRRRYFSCVNGHGEWVSAYEEAEAAAVAAAARAPKAPRAYFRPKRRF